MRLHRELRRCGQGAEACDWRWQGLGYGGQRAAHRGRGFSGRLQSLYPSVSGCLYPSGWLSLAVSLSLWLSVSVTVSLSLCVCHCLSLSLSLSVSVPIPLSPYPHPSVSPPSAPPEVCGCRRRVHNGPVAVAGEWHEAPVDQSIMGKWRKYGWRSTVAADGAPHTISFYQCAIEDCAVQKRTERHNESGEVISRVLAAV
jgi:hypothetical protein